MSNGIQRRMLWTAAAVLCAQIAHAQDATKICKAGSADEMLCTVAGVPVTPIIHRFGEGVVHAPGSELAYLVIANYDSEAVIVTARFLIEGFGLEERAVEVPAHTRLSYALHDDQQSGAFLGLRTFSVRVFAPADTIDVALVGRPQAAPFSHATLTPVSVK